MKIDRFNRSRVLTSDELDQVHDQLSGPHRVLATLLRKTAARVSEGLALRWKYVTPTSIVYIKPTTKGKRQTRSVPLDPNLAKELSAWKQLVNPTDNPDAWVFPSARCPGEHMSRRAFDHALRKVCTELDLKGFLNVLSDSENFDTSNTKALNWILEVEQNHLKSSFRTDIINILLFFYAPISQVGTCWCFSLDKVCLR